MLDKFEIMEVVPCDVWLQVFEYGIIDDALKVHDLTKEFEKACCLYTKHQLLSLQYRIRQGVSAMQERLKELAVFEDNLRVSIVKSIMFLRYLITELNILICTVRRYSTNSKAWMILSPHLTSVIEEFDNIRRDAVALELRREELTNFNVRMLLTTYYGFLQKFDSDLEERLSEIVDLTPFEIKAIEVLSCCPSINSQLSLMKEVNENQAYNICAFFRIHNLKPIFQVPDVHNTNLSNQHKLSKLITYLRDCVQWENVTFLQNFISEITDMELRLSMSLMDEFTRFMLIGKLLKKYEGIQCSPYEPFQRTIFMAEVDSGTFLSEHYSKQITLNQNMTGLSVIITTPNQPKHNLPIIVHSVRGKWKPFVDETVLDSVYCEFNFHKLKDNLASFSRNKRVFQLCINFREGLNSTPAEAIIDVSCDQNGESHVSMNIVRSEPFTEQSLCVQQ